MLHAAHCHLAIAVGHNCMRAGVIDCDRNEVIWLKEFANGSDENMATFVSGIFTSNKIFGGIFRRTTWTGTGEKFLLIPAAFYEPGSARQLLQFSTVENGGSTLTHMLRNDEIAVAFVLPESLVTAVDENCTSAKIISLAAVYCDYAMTLNRRHEKIILAVIDGHLLMVAAVDTSLRLCNHFQSPQPDDVLYHIANVAMQVNFDLASVRIVLAGDVQPAGELMIRLRTYAPHATIATFEEAKLAGEVSSETIHRYAPVLAQMLCA